MHPSNLLFILSDEHQRDIAGCYGDPIAITPNIDALAARGARFTNAYTPCPICVPARAALATGRWVHQTKAWDNAAPYHGEMPSWHHRLREQRPSGRLDRQAAFPRDRRRQRLQRGDPSAACAGRQGRPHRHAARAAGRARQHAGAGRERGPGQSTYNDYDRAITAAACRWIAAKGERASDKPWALFVSLVRPHFPLTAPPEFYALYPPERDADAAALRRGGASAPPCGDGRCRSVMNYDDYFDDEQAVRRAIASYYALVSFLDDNIGKVLAALEAAGLDASTRVIYTSDHGDNLGCRGLWGKSVMYEESAAIPMIMAGAGVASGAVVDTPVSLVDCYSTVLEAVGCPSPADDLALPSHSLWEIAAGARPDRDVLSEYHAAASITGTFMIRHGRWKYIHHVGYRPELFDLEGRSGRDDAISRNGPTWPPCSPSARPRCCASAIRKP